jgi:isopenicillin N synthase-like dioxygenase
MAQTQVPTIDLSSATADELSEALIQWSCALVAGHGIPDELQQEMSEISTEFFDLPEEEKNRVRWSGKGMWEAWVPVYRGDPDIVAEGSTPDLVEWFQFQRFEDFDQWPERPARMREVWKAYYDACSGLATKIISMLAESLELPADDVSAWTDEAFRNLAVNNYPPQPEPPLPGQVRLSPHTDENGLTLLTSRKDTGGLQVRKPGATDWTPVTIPQGTYFVQPGDLLARWTNRLVYANHHRVVNPPREVAAATRRQTMIFFHYPSWDALITPAPSCVERSGEPQLPPLNVGEHIMRNQDVYAAGDETSRLDESKV